jgi:hypothetical protein
MISIIEEAVAGRTDDAIKNRTAYDAQNPTITITDFVASASFIDTGDVRSFI